MARPRKNNADYFSHDADMRNDPKIRALRRKYSHVGYAVWNYLLEFITDSDYFEVEWSDMNIEILAGDFDIEPTELREIADYCVTLGLFQIEDNRLTCSNLKTRFKALLGKRNPTKEEFSEPKPQENGVSDVENPHKKREEKKLKETKVNNTKRNECECSDAQMRKEHPPTHSQDFLELENFIKNFASRVAQMQEPFTDEQAQQLFRDFLIPRNDKGKFIKKILTEMHNSAELLNKNVSAYLTFIKFAKNAK